MPRQLFCFVGTKTFTSILQTPANSFPEIWWKSTGIMCTLLIQHLNKCACQTGLQLGCFLCFGISVWEDVLLGSPKLHLRPTCHFFETPDAARELDHSELEQWSSLWEAESAQEKNGWRAGRKNGQQIDRTWRAWAVGNTSRSTTLPNATAQVRELMNSVKIK